MGRQNPDCDKDWMPRLKVDFSAESSRREEMKAALMQQLPRAAEGRPQKENTAMKTTKRRIKRSGAIALAACLSLGAISVTAYAVVQHLKLGQHANYIVQEELSPEEQAKRQEEMMARPLPEDLAGKLYASDGKAAETWGDLDEGTYEVDGKKIAVRSDTIAIMEEGTPKTMAQELASLNEISTRFETEEEVRPLLAFDLMRFTYIPEGYELEGFRLFTGGEEDPDFANSKYLSMNFYKDQDPEKHIYVQVRYMDEETGYESGLTEDGRKTTINGYDAVVDGKSVDMLVEDVMYMISVGDALPAEEAMKMAESLAKR